METTTKKTNAVQQSLVDIVAVMGPMPEFLMRENTPESKARVAAITAEVKKELVMGKAVAGPKEAGLRALREGAAPKKDVAKLKAGAAKKAAEAAGETKKMPLTGKAALKAIADAAVASGKTVTKVPAGVTAKTAVKAAPATNGEAKGTKKPATKAAPEKPAKAPAAEKPAKAKAAKAKGENKADMVERMLKSPKGATRKELSDASGWKSVNLRLAAERAGMKIKEEKDGRVRLV